MANTTLTETEVAALYSVSQAQLDKCHLTEKDGRYYYVVESQTTEGVQYDCKYNRQHGCFTCTCKAGIEGRACWHKRAAMASLTLYKQEVKARREAEARKVEATPEYHEEHSEWSAEVAKAAAREAKAVKRYGSRAYEGNTFSLLK